MNEFQATEQAETNRIVQQRQTENRNELGLLLSKIEDIDNRSLQLDEVIKELTPSDDLETVKMRLNQVISVINQLAV